MKQAYIWAVLALLLTAGPAWAKGTKVTARADASGVIVYTVTPETPKAKAQKLPTTQDWTKPGPKYDADGTFRGMVYNMKGRK